MSSASLMLLNPSDLTFLKFNKKKLDFQVMYIFNSAILINTENIPDKKTLPGDHEIVPGDFEDIKTKFFSQLLMIVNLAFILCDSLSN